MKKILMLADSGSIHTKKWVEILRPFFEIFLVSFSLEKIEGIICINLDLNKKINEDGGNIVYFKKLWEINQIIKKIKPDLINAHYLTSYGFIGALLKRKSIPLVLSVHGDDIVITPKKNIFYRLATIFTLKKSDHIFSVAQHMTNEIFKYVKLASNRVSTLQYGVDLQRIASYHSDERDINFISTRNLYPNSNIDIIIKSFEKYVRNSDSRATLYITGCGYLDSFFKEYIKANSLSKNIVMTGHLSQEELFKLLGRSKYFISLTNSDGTSLSLLEAIAAGCIPIVSDIEANRYWIRHGESGYISKINIDSLFNMLNIVIYDSRMLNNAKAKITKEADYTKNSQIISNKIIDLSHRTL